MKLLREMLTTTKNRETRDLLKIQLRLKINQLAKARKVLSEWDKIVDKARMELAKEGIIVKLKPKKAEQPA